MKCHTSPYSSVLQTILENRTILHWVRLWIEVATMSRGSTEHVQIPSSVCHFSRVFSVHFDLGLQLHSASSHVSTFQSLPAAWNLRGQNLWQKSVQSSTWLSHQGPSLKTVAFRIHFVVEDFGCQCHGVHQTQPSPCWGCWSAERFPCSIHHSKQHELLFDKTKKTIEQNSME